MAGLYAIITRDNPSAIAIRKEKLAEHLAHVETCLDRIAIAGPLRDEAGAFVGSLLVVKAASEAEARAFIEQDPYYHAGIWSSIEISAFAAAAGEWVGGKTW